MCNNTEEDAERQKLLLNQLLLLNGVRNDEEEGEAGTVKADTMATSKNKKNKAEIIVKNNRSNELQRS